MADFSNPKVGSAYTSFPTEVRDAVTGALTQLSTGSHSNIPDGAIKWDANNNKWIQKISGSFNSHLSATYNFTNLEATQLDLGNNQKIRLGSSQNLQLFVDGSNNSLIQETGAGNLSLQSNGAEIQLAKGGTFAHMIRAIVDGAVMLYDSGNERLKTDSNGIQVTSRVGIGGAASHPLDVFGNTIQLGASNTQTQELRVGRAGSGNRNVDFSLIGDNTNSTYGFRITRNSGVNGNSDLKHKGTGNLRIISQDSGGDIEFLTQDTFKAILTDTGRLGVGLSNPDVTLHTRDQGSIYALFGGNQNSDGSSAIRQIKLFTTAFRGSIQSLQASGSSFVTNDLLLNPDGSDVMVGAAENPDSRFEVRDSTATGIISRASNTQNTDSNKALRVRNNNTTDVFSVSYRGLGYFASRLGIGTTSSDTLLHVTGDKPKFRLESTNSLEASAGTEEIARIEFEAKKSSNLNVCASMRVRQDGTWSTSDDFFSPTAIEFYTQDQSGSEITTPRVTINSLGNMGVGVTPSTTRLQVKGVSGTYPTCLIEHSNADVEGEFLRIGRTDVTGIRYHSLKAMHGGAASNNFISVRIHTGSTTTSQSEVVRIKGDQRVGLLTSNPSSLLHLIGIQTITAGAFANNISTGNRDFTASIDIQATSMRGGVVVRNMNNFRSATTSASFMHYDPYDTTAVSFAFRASRGATLADTFYVKSSGQIYTSDKLGIGVESPDTSLHVHKGSAGSASSDSNSVLTLENNNHCILQMLSPAANSNRIMFGDPSDSNVGEINYDHNGNFLKFTVNTNKEIRIDATGRLLINRTSGSYHLDVSGSARISNYIYLSNAQRVVWGTSNTAFIQGDDNVYLLFAVNNEVFRISQNALRIGQTVDDTVGQDDTNVGASIEKNGRISSSTSGTTTGININTNTQSNSKHYISMRRNGSQIGSVTQNGASNVAFNDFSDRRVKEEIVPILNALTTLLKLKPVNYNYKADKEKKKFDGFIAQDLLEDKVCDYAATYIEREDWYGIDYSKLVTIAIAAIQELAGKVSDLESKLA